MSASNDTSPMSISCRVWVMCMVAQCVPKPYTKMVDFKDLQLHTSTDFYQPQALLCLTAHVHRFTPKSRNMVDFMGSHLHIWCGRHNALNIPLILQSSVDKSKVLRTRRTKLVEDSSFQPPQFCSPATRSLCRELVMTVTSNISVATRKENYL